MSSLEASFESDTNRTGSMQHENAKKYLGDLALIVSEAVLVLGEGVIQRDTYFKLASPFIARLELVMDGQK